VLPSLEKHWRSCSLRSQNLKTIPAQRFWYKHSFTISRMGLGTGNEPLQCNPRKTPPPRSKESLPLWRATQSTGPALQMAGQWLCLFGLGLPVRRVKCEVTYSWFTRAFGTQILVRRPSHRRSCSSSSVAASARVSYIVSIPCNTLRLADSPTKG
jgi:hypothetical protein